MVRRIFILLLPLFAFSLYANPVDSIRTLANEGNPEAMYKLAYLYDIGYGDLDRDTLESSRLYLKAAEKGFIPAQSFIGFRYYRGEGVKKDVNKALKWIQRAAEQGDAKAQNNLGWMLMEGDGVQHDFNKAAYWLNSAAEQGLPVAMSQLADLYKTGKGVECDTTRAEALYQRAFMAGLADAQDKLLDMQLSRYEALSSQDALTAGKFYLSIGAYRIAATLFEIAAQDETNADALAYLANAYSRGEGVEYNHQRSLQLFLRSARLGNPASQFVIGELLEMFPDAFNELPEEDTSQLTDEEFSAIYWYELAAEKGITDARKATEYLLAP